MSFVIFVKRFTLIICVLLFSFKLKSQEAYFNWEGRILSKNRQSIEFAHIQINTNGKHFLYMSDANGFVSIRNRVILPSDSVIISCIGYETKKMTVLSLITSDSIVLTGVSYEISEVIVKPKKCKIITIGNKKREPIGHTHISFNEQSALKISSHNVNGQILSAKIYMYNKSETEWKYRPFRFRLYEGGEGIGKELLKNEIIAYLQPDDNNWVTINLSPFNIDMPSNGVVVSVEALSAEYYINHGYIETVISKNGLVNSISVGWTFDGIRGGKGIESWRYSEYNGWHQRNSKNNFLYKINIEVCEE